MPKRKQGEVDNQGVQDFELIELLIREAGSNAVARPSTSTQQGSGFESFKARFQSYIDQIPSYLHSVGKEGFFPHFFLGSFSTLIDTEIATKLDIEKIYFSFDGSKTLKVAVIKKGGITSPEDAANKVKLFVIGESDSTRKKFSYGELDKVLGNANIVQNNHVRQARDEGKLGVKLVKITKKKDAKGKTAGISVEVKSDNLDQDTSTAHDFKEIKKGVWNNPESDIAELTNSDKKEVKKSLNKVLKKIGEVHSGYRGEFKEERLFIRDGSLTYAKEAREGAHHGFIAGALVNFRYRHNLRVYLEQFAGRGYADIVLVPRGKDRSLNAVPIIIEMKAATKAELKEGKIGEKSGTTPTAALKQAEDYTKGFQPNVMRVLTTANDILCVGVNLDHPSPISDIMDKSRNQKITPLFDEILISIDGRNNGRINEEGLKEKVQNNVERICHTFPGTGEKGDNHYFSRFLLGQSLLLNEVQALESNFEKHVFIYGENIPTETRSEGKERDVPQREAAKKGGEKLAESTKLDQSHGVTTMVFIPENDKRSVYVMNIVETDGRTEVLKKGIPLDQLKQKVGDRKIVELDLNFNINEKSNFEKYFSMEVSEPISLAQYNNRKNDKFKGSFENVPYPNELKEAFDEVLNSQHIDQSASEVSDPEKLKETLNKALDRYKELLAKVGEGVSPFKSLIEKEAHFQAVLHGLFSHYSDIKLGESPESRALVLTEFQTGKGKRVDMLVHGVKFADRGSNAKEYIPIGLELKGPREGKEADGLKKEANKQITDEYKEGVTYKTLTDGDKVACVGVVFDKKAGNANSLIELSNEKEFTPVKVVHSSIMQIGQQPLKKKFNLDSCVKPGGRSKRSVNSCLFSKDDVEKFSKGKVDENNVDKIIVDSEKFLTYVKNSQDEAKNAQLVEFVGDKNIEGDHKYLLDKVVRDQGYEGYIQNERIKDLQGDVLQQNSGLTKNPKLKSRLMNAAGGIQLIRGIHGAIVSCKDGTATDCGLNLGGMAWSFASQPIENVMVKITPKVVESAGKVVGKIPGVLGKQTRFGIRIAGVKFGSKIAKGAAGAITGVFDIVDIGMSTNNLVDCKKRENSDNPCGEKEIRDNIASIAFSGVSFISGVALVANPIIGITAGFALMVVQGIYSGISNVIEYEKKYDTTHDENWRIFWHTFAFQPIPEDVQHLAARKEVVNSFTKGAWKTLNNSSDNVVAYAFGLGGVSGNTLSSSSAKILMNKKDTAYTKNLSRVIPDNIEGVRMICLPEVTGQDYEKGITSSVSSAVYHCKNAVVISRSNTNQVNPMIVYDLRNIVDGTIIGSNEWNNNFLIDKGNIEITGSNNVVIGGDNVVNKFVFLDTPSSSGEVLGGRNSTNILDLSEAKKDRNINVAIQDNIVSGNLKVRINGRILVNSVDPSNYYYVGRKSKVDEVLCMGHSTPFTRHEVIVDSGGVEGSERDIVENCRKVILSPYTTVLGREGSYTFYVRVTNLKGKNLHSEINAKGTGTVVFSEFDLLSDCGQITYSTDSNTLSLKINFGQDNQFTLDIKNYVEQSSNKPHFVLIDKNGSNIVPKIEKSDSSIIKINSFELHSEYSLDNFDDVETHYKKILNSNKDYKVLSVIRSKTQSQDNNIVPNMIFGSLGDDVINFNQGTMFARGGKGSDMYVIPDDINNKEVKIDNHSDDEKADTLFMPEVEKDFLVQQCDLHLNYNNTGIQVKNYFQGRNYRHFIIMNKKGEAFIPDIQSMSCSSSSRGKLIPFLQATQTQNMFLLPKDFADDHVVIDSRLEDIEKYKDQDDLLLVREGENPFIIRIEGFYTDRDKWENISYSLWNNNDLSPSPQLLENIDNVVEYKDKLRSDYERVVKEYNEDFSSSTSIIHHNQKLEKNVSIPVEQDEERIGVMMLKNITPGQVEVSSSGKDLIFRDKKSNHTINVENWDNSESYRVSALEFDLGLGPIKILRLNRFSLSDVGKIQDLIGKASENYQNRDKSTPKVESDFKCLISLHSLMKKPTYQCSGFFSLQDQTDFVKNACSREQVEEFENNIPSARQFMMLLEKLHNDLSLNGYNQNTIDKCSQVITSGFGVLNLWINKAVDEDKWDEVQTLLDRTANRGNADVEHKSKCSKSWTLLNYFVYNGNVDLGKDIFKLILKKSGSIDAFEDGNGWAALHYAVHYGDINMTSFLVDEGAKVDVRNKEGKTPLYLVIEEVKKNKLDMIKLLVERGADIEAKDTDGKSPLYLITYSGDLETIKLLFEMIKAKDNSSLKTIKEIDSLRRKIINQQNIPSTVKNFVDSYVSDAVQTVAEELRDNVSMRGCAAIVGFGDEIYEFNKELFKEIVREFISVVYGKTLNSDGILECINSYNHTEEKIYSYIALLDEMKRNDHISDNAAFKLAYNVKEIIGSGGKYDLREIKNRLPGCVNDVVFPSKVCIRNVEYDEYLYSTNIKVTDGRRVIATNSIDKTPWKVEFEDGKFYIMNTKGEYLYAADYGQYDDERRSVFTWIEGSQVEQSPWKIEPAKDGNCYIQNVYQREYLYSPVDYFKGKYSGSTISSPRADWRPVFTWIGGNDVHHNEWKFEDCSRSRRKRDVEEFESEVSLGSHLFQVAKARENSNDTQILELSARLQDNLLPNSHSDESIVHWYSRPGNQEMLNKMMSSVLASVKEVIYPDQLNSRLDLDSCSKNNASSCPPLMRNIYNTINLDKKSVITDKKNVLEVTSGYQRLDIENFPIQEKVINVNRKGSIKRTLDLSKLVKQVDRDLGIKPIPMIVKEKNDLLIKLSISASGLKKDVMAVRLKDALINNWYKNLQIIFDSAPVEIDNNLKLTPSVLISDSKIIVVTPKNIEEGNKLIICREVEGYTFLHHKYDLIMTNALSANVSEKELYVMYFKDFYKEPKMKTLSIRFIDKEILLDDKINKIYNSGSIDKLNYANFTLDLQDRGINIKANDFHDDKVLKLAYCIKEVIEKTNNKEEISSFERLKNKLPESVKNIVFSPTACIKNIKSNGYLYASSDKFRYNHERRVVSTQVGGRKNQQVFWKVDPSHGNSYIENVEFNECLHPPVNDMHSSEGRNIFTLIRRGDTRCNFWKFEPVGENVRIQDAQSGGYLYVPIHNSKHNNNGSNVGTERTKDEKSLWRLEDCGFTRNKRDIKQLESKVSLDSKTIKAKKRASGSQTSASSGRLQRDFYLSRKPLAIDSSNQPEITASSGTRPSSWINDCISWVKSSVGKLLSSKSEGTASSVSQVDGQFAKASVSNSSLTSTTLPSDGTDKRQENGGFFRDNVDYVNANLKRMCERQAPVKFKPIGGNTILEMGDHYLSQVDFNGTITLFDLLIRRVTGQKYISTGDQSISPLEAKGYALSITKGFEKVVEQAGLKSGVSMHRLDIDYMGMQKEITRKVMSGKFNEISGILKSYVEKACPDEEAGKLSPKKFDKFMLEFNSRLNVVLNQSIEQILHNRDGRLEVDDTKQMSLEPQSYLSNASVHSHSEVSTCLSEIGVTKLGGNLNR